MICRLSGLTTLANSDVDRGTPSDLPAGGRRLSKRLAGRGVGTAGAVDCTGPARRATTQDRHARGDERYSLSAAHWLPLALPAARQFSTALDGLQHLSQVSAGWRLGGDLGRVAHRLARTDGSGGQ